jgi:hypothetical protein
MATKSKSAPRAKAKATSQSKKKPAAKAAPKKAMKAAVKAAPLKIAKAAPKQKAQPKPQPQAEHKHPFWKLLEAKEQQRKEHEQGLPHGDRSVQKQIEYRHQAKYARFAGPRRRAA